MGRQFIGNYGGPGHLYGCRECSTYITTAHELTSSNFTGGTGPAMLFRHAWNVEYGKLERRRMFTGLHLVRDVSCVTCKAKLGWMYEIAMVDKEKYKETQIILENALITRLAENLRDPLGEDDTKFYSHSIERPRNRMSSETFSMPSRSSSESSYSSVV